MGLREPSYLAAPSGTEYALVFVGRSGEPFPSGVQIHALVPGVRAAQHGPLTAVQPRVSDESRRNRPFSDDSDARRSVAGRVRGMIAIEQSVVALAIERPAWGQVRVSAALKRRG